MNAKFFDVKKDKQDSIINASLRIFAQKGYKDASTDVIVKEAGISKGLLFHYFESKQGLYEFICDYSSKYMTLELTRQVKPREKDFFEIMSQIEQGKMRVLRNYPYMQMFLQSMKYETDPEALSVAASSLEEMNTTYRNIYAQINNDRFINPEYSLQIIQIIEWIGAGFMKDKFAKGNPNPDEMYEEYASYLTMLRKHLYKSDTNSRLSVAKEEVYERDDSIMDSMRYDMTFEERLLAGKRPLVDKTEEEIAAEERAAEEKAAREQEETAQEAKDEESQEPVSEYIDNQSINEEVKQPAVPEVTTAIVTNQEPTDEIPEEEYFDEEDKEPERAEELAAPEASEQIPSEDAKREKSLEIIGQPSESEKTDSVDASTVANDTVEISNEDAGPDTSESADDAETIPVIRSSSIVNFPY